MKRGIILSDTHCGNIGGLVPVGHMQDDYRATQIPFWNWFERSVSEYGPFDFAICVGDLVDGEGKKGTLDTIATSIDKQAEWAADILRFLDIDSEHVYLVRGTPFHTNGACEYENKIAEALNCSIADTQKLEIEGWRIHSRHVVGRSDIPYGQATPLLKELARCEAEALRDCKPVPDIIIRAHVHYSCFVGKHGRLAIDCPCLCLPIGSANGRRYMAWEYDVGFGVLELEEKKEPIYHPVIMPIRNVHTEEYLCVKW